MFDYRQVTDIFYNDETIEWQSQLLYSYYPIGMEIKFYKDKNIDINTNIDKKDIFVIEKHIFKKTYNIYNIRIRSKRTGHTTDIHPGYFEPTREWLRKYKLERILNESSLYR